MNLQVQMYKGEIQWCSRLDNKHHIRWWRRSKILIALSAEAMCRFRFPTAPRVLLNPKYTLEFLNVNKTRPRGRASPNLKVNYEPAKRGKCLLAKKCLKEHQCRLGPMNIWCLSPSVQSATHHLVSNGVNFSSMWMWAACVANSQTSLSELKCNESIVSLLVVSRNDWAFKRRTFLSVS